MNTGARPLDGPPEDYQGLPNFCAGGALLVLILLGIALALLVALAGIQARDQFWLAVGLNGLFILWVILTSAALLCLGRRLLESLGPRASPWIAFGLIQLVVVAYSGLIIAVPDQFGGLDLLAVTDAGLFLARNLGISVIASFILVRYLSLLQRWKAQVAAESSARLEALQARIQPHFLFNALNTIAGLIRERPDQAEAATLDLSDLLRTGLRADSRHKLIEELNLVRGYLRIEKLRLGDRLRVEWSLAENLPLDLSLPALLIQPLVENAVIHGIARLPEGGRLSIRGWRDGGKVRFRIDNPVGAGDADLARSASSEAASDVPSNHMALTNIRQRLTLAYEDQARLRFRQADGQFSAELSFPAGN